MSAWDYLPQFEFSDLYESRSYFKLAAILDDFQKQECQSFREYIFTVRIWFSKSQTFVFVFLSDFFFKFYFIYLIKLTKLTIGQNIIG